MERDREVEKGEKRRKGGRKEKTRENGNERVCLRQKQDTEIERRKERRKEKKREAKRSKEDDERGKEREKARKNEAEAREIERRKGGTKGE